MFIPTQWVDEVVEFPNRYKETNNPDGTIDHVPAPGQTIKDGTPQSATNFNHMELGVLEALLIGSENSRMLASVTRDLAGITGEVIQQKLQNSQVYPFNDSTATVKLGTQRNTKDYTITPEIVSVSGGAVGDIEFSEKLLNGFKVHFTGSAKEVTLNLYVRGGI